MAAVEKEEAAKPPSPYVKVIALWGSPSFVNNFPRTELYTWLTIFDPADHPLEITPTERDDVVYKNLACILRNLRERDGTIPYHLAGFLDNNPLSLVYDAEDNNFESKETIESAAENVKFGKPGSIISKVYLSTSDTSEFTVRDGEYM